MSFYDQNRPFGVRENAPKAIERALLDPPSPKRAMPPQRGWRQQVRFLNQFRRCGSYREAAARIGVDESMVRRWRARFEGFRNHCDAIVAERYRQNADDLKLRAGEPKSRPYFFKGKQIGEQVIHDDRALMFLLKLEDAQRARAEAREERREQRAHEIRLKEMETRKMHASAAHPPARAAAEASAETNDLPAVAADIAPPEVVEAHRRPERSEAEPRDLASLSTVPGEEGRSLDCAAVPAVPLGTTGRARSDGQSDDVGGDRI